ncbi:MAG: hypothetical protein V3581_00755 [Candidatus Cardinium sp.]
MTYDILQAISILTEVQHMAQETLAIDLQIANTYLGPEIGEALEAAAKEALELVNTKKK